MLEDTANGHKKYSITEFYKKSNKFISVAYDTYKMAENVMVAKIIIENFHSFISDWSISKSVLVVGYGRIGRSLCFGLREKGLKNIVVVDNDNARLFMASIEGFESVMVNQLYKIKNTFDYCFSMSGHNGVTEEVLSSLKNRSYLSVVTSYDDEFSKTVKDLFESSSRDLIFWEGKKLTYTRDTSSCRSRCISMLLLWQRYQNVHPAP